MFVAFPLLLGAFCCGVIAALVFVGLAVHIGPDRPPYTAPPVPIPPDPTVAENAAEVAHLAKLLTGGDYHRAELVRWVLASRRVNPGRPGLADTHARYVLTAANAIALAEAQHMEEITRDDHSAPSIVPLTPTRPGVTRA